MIAPHRSSCKLKTQNGRSLRRYARRWVVERFFAWIHWKRRLLVRWEYYAENFLGFVQLAAVLMLLKRFCDRFSSFDCDPHGLVTNRLEPFVKNVIALGRDVIENTHGRCYSLKSDF